jgi:hypothetical protein
MHTVHVVMRTTGKISFHVVPEINVKKSSIEILLQNYSQGILHHH